MLDDGGDLVNREVIALAVNLAANSRNAGTPIIFLLPFLPTALLIIVITEIMCEGANLMSLIRRAAKTGDPFLMKLIRNISHHEGKCKELFVVSIITSNNFWCCLVITENTKLFMCSTICTLLG